MQPEERDAAYLWDMLEAGREAVAFMTGEYGEILQERLWRVVTVHLPALIAQLEPLIPPLPPEAAE